jgi:hypothetical protein
LIALRRTCQAPFGVAVGVVLALGCCAIAFPVGAESAATDATANDATDASDAKDAAAGAGSATRTMDVPSLGGSGSQGGPGAGSRDGSPGLDALLQLPSGYGGRAPVASPVVAGAGEAEWRRRFRDTHETLGDARRTLEATKRELDDTALESGGTQWNVAPPTGGGGGGSQSASPLSFKLRQKLKADREALEAAEKAVRELDIEANLAGVPKEWRAVPEVEAPPEVGQLVD